MKRKYSTNNKRPFGTEKHSQALEKDLVLQLLNHVENILLNGTELILERVFNKVGFNQIEDNIFRKLVQSRLSYPSSKSATVEYLKNHFDEDINLSKIYRYLDKLNHTQQDKIQNISVVHTQRLLGGQIGVLFYDVTTLYFETDKEDELRKTGFSKEGRHSNPQIILGLLVSADGLKGYLTNTELSVEQIHTAYHNLWNIEMAFRISKSKIEIRPIFHFTRKRIEAHICICFVALKVYKELERILKQTSINMSVDKVLNMARTITTIQIKMPLNNQILSKTMIMKRHKRIESLFDERFWGTH